MSALYLVTPPAADPLSLEQVKHNLNIDYDDDDLYLTALLTAATQEVERLINRAIMPQTWQLYLDRFPPNSGPIYIPKPPLQSVTSVTFTDTEFNINTVPGPSGGVGGANGATYIVDVHREPGVVTPSWSNFWPPVVLQPIDSVCVTFVAGYASAAKVPTIIKQAIMFLITEWYVNRTVAFTNGSIAELPAGLAVVLASVTVPPADNFRSDRYV